MSRAEKGKYRDWMPPHLDEGNQKCFLEEVVSELGLEGLMGVDQTDKYGKQLVERSRIELLGATPHPVFWLNPQFPELFLLR